MGKTSFKKQTAGLVSIIVPVYNAERSLQKCIESAINQTYKKTELILIADKGSKDKSEEICEQFVHRDPRIRALHVEHCAPGAARETGIRESKGEFLFFLDADDFLQENALELLVEGNMTQNADLVIGDYRKIKNGAPETRNDISFPESRALTKKDAMEYAIQYLRRPNKHLLFSVPWGRLYRSSIIREHGVSFNPTLFTYEDIAFNYDYLKFVKKVYFLKETIYNYAVYDGFSSASMSFYDNPERLFSFGPALASIRKFLLDGGYDDKTVTREIGHAFVFLTIIQLVRTCGQVRGDDEKLIHAVIRKLIDDPVLRDSLKYYSPKKGDSKVIPLLMRLRLVSPIFWVCRHKARKRYKRT